MSSRGLFSGRSLLILFRRYVNGRFVHLMWKKWNMYKNKSLYVENHYCRGIRSIHNNPVRIQPTKSAPISATSKLRPRFIQPCINSMTIPNRNEKATDKTTRLAMFRRQGQYLRQSTSIQTANPPKRIACASLSAPGNREIPVSPKGRGESVSHIIATPDTIVSIHAGNNRKPRFILQIYEKFPDRYKKIDCHHDNQSY